MGFLDKAKKAAEQAQKKLDDVQRDLTASPGAGPGAGAGVEYDQHGRAIRPAQPAAEQPAAADVQPVAEAPADAIVPPPPPPAPQAPAVAPSGGIPDVPRDEYAAPQISSGDPLAG